MTEERQNAGEGGKSGQLKIFFGYAAGVGKTYAMLQAALTAEERGMDVVIGSIAPYRSLEDTALAERLRAMERLEEFDLDRAIRRKPDLIIMDDLACENPKGSRHSRRYQDIRELLKAGISVYTTVSAQNIESLNDIVTAITRVPVKDRIPDSVFDHADQVELVDLEPRELLERLRNGALAEKEGEHPPGTAYFTVANLTALREVALRRCADRINMLTRGDGAAHGDEHVLVCLSASPSNAKIVRTAARMANAFRGAFTALFVKTPDLAYMDEEDRKRLQSHMRLAEQLGARIEILYSDDIPFQIAEFARISGVSKIVIGRSAATRDHIFSKPALTEKLISNAPDLDVYIIPDADPGSSFYRKRHFGTRRHLVFSAGDILKSIGILLAASCIGFFFYNLGVNEANIITIYVLGVLVTALVTKNQIYSLISSAVSVLVFNFLFTEPRYTLQAYAPGYPLTFSVMFLSAFITGSLVMRLKSHAKQSAEVAFRTRILFDTNRLLQQARGQEEITSVSAGQLVKLLKKDIVVYPAENGVLGEPQIFQAGETEPDAGCISAREREVALSEKIKADEALLARFELVKETITAVRNIRKQKNLPQREALTLEVIADANYPVDYAPVLTKMANLSAIERVAEKDAAAAAFIVKTTQYFVPLGDRIDREAEIAKLGEELTYYEGFLQSVERKLSNERFMQSAPEKVVANERAKQADAEAKITAIREQLAALESGK